MTIGKEIENADLRIRKILTKSRLVHHIDSALDLQNYDRLDPPETEKKITGVIKDRNSTEEIHFTNNPQSFLNFGRVSRHKIIRSPVGLKNVASKAKIEIDHFLLFNTHEMLADVLHHTNKKIDSQIAKHPPDFNKDFKYSFMKEVSEMELKAFIGLFLYRGLYKLNKMGTRKLVSDSYGPPMFSAVSLVIVLHLFYTICPLLMKVPVLKDGKRTGLLRLVIFLKNSIIIACWS